MDVFLGVGAEFDAPGIGHLEEVLVFAELHGLVELAPEAEMAVDDVEGRLVVTELHGGRAILGDMSVVVRVMTRVG